MSGVIVKVATVRDSLENARRGLDLLETTGLSQAQLLDNYRTVVRRAVEVLADIVREGD